MSTQPYRKQYTEGQKIGELTFINRVPVENGGNPLANFRCQCGNEFITRIKAAEVGKTKSCGCLRPKIISKPKNIYIIGQKLGTCIYLGDRPYPPNAPRRANFLCECGKEFETRINNVESGETKSCGCMTNKFHSEKGHFHEKYIPILTEEDAHRFWSKVGFTANPDKCWEWQANLSNGRYGSFSIKGSMFKSNRVAYFLSFKQDPKKLSVIHSCDNPKCCNPKHLSLGTHWENMQDMAQKGRAYNGKIKYQENV